LESCSKWIHYTSFSPIDNVGKNPSEYNSKAINFILSGIIGSKFVNVMHCDSANEILENPKNVYDRDAKVKGVKI
jgi:hypothetical protein